MILAVVGTIGSGKDFISEFIAEEFGFEKFSLGDALRQELKGRGIELTRENLQDYGDEFRRSEGSDYLAVKVCRPLEKGKDYVFTSIRNPSELEYIKDYFGELTVVMVTAPFGKRLEILRKRKRENDPITFERFAEVDARDFGVGQAVYAQQNAGCFEMANKVIVNNGSIDELKDKVRKLINDLGKGN